MGWGKGHETLLALIASGQVKTSILRAFLRSHSVDEIAGLAGDALGRRLGLADRGLSMLGGATGGSAAMLAGFAAGGVTMVALGEQGYPMLLKEIADPPPAIFVRGALVEADGLAVAIVGSRRPSLAGARLTWDLAADLAGAGFTIVSGLARGIDTAAHRGALAAGGRTIAVLGSGVDVVYPPENADLAGAIADHGAILSELLPGTAPRKQHFPRRNRLISGLAMGTVVVEAGEKSGALSTAGFALDQNRTVFAVPGSPGHARSKGANRLLKEGARLVEAAEDVLEDLAPQLSPVGRAAQLRMPLLPGGSQSNLSPDEVQVVTLLSDTPVHVDEMARHLGMGAHSVLALLLALETRGLVKALPGKFYVRSGLA